MTLIICICDYQQHREFLHISDSNGLHSLPALALRQNELLGATLRRLKWSVDGVSAFYLLRELREWTRFRDIMRRTWTQRGVQLLWLQIVPPPKEILDYKWNSMLARTLWEKIEIEYLMSWLSTLGGGFSALGEQFSKCAETAGRISLKQLAIGLRLGDPFLQARCKLYYSISLIQTGRLRAAKHLVREQYEFARKFKEVDGRLVKMCQGIWLRLQYEYAQRRERRERHVQLIKAAGDK